MPGFVKLMSPEEPVSLAMQVLKELDFCTIRCREVGNAISGFRLSVALRMGVQHCNHPHRGLVDRSPGARGLLTPWRLERLVRLIIMRSPKGSKITHPRSGAVAMLCWNGTVGIES